METRDMKTFKKLIRFLDRIVDRCLMIIFLAVFLMGAYGLLDSYLVYADTSDSAIEKLRPDYSGDEEPEKEIEGTMAAWITMDGSTIDYPVMQGETNTEYLSKDPFGDYSLAGSIFLDSRNNAGFTDAYSLIYGHHMEHGLMFGALDDWLDEGYFEKHLTGTLTIGNEELELRVFAVLESEATEERLFAPTECPYDEVLDYILDHALYAYEANIPDGERIVALSTCKFPDTADRTILACSLSGSVVE